jgi:RNA polymerase sigma-70 factor (ECF subfamily)
VLVADVALVRALHAEHGTVLESYALGLTGGDPGRAQDAVREVLVRAWRDARLLSGDPGSVRRWLLGTLRSVLIEDWRTRSGRPKRVKDDERGPRYSRAAVHALTRLCRAERDVLDECFYRGHSVRDAAERLGVAADTVRSRAYDALCALRAELMEEGVVP